MEFFPNLEICWVNGWVFLAIHVLILVILFKTSSRDVSMRLLDRKNWIKLQRAFTVVGKLFTLINLILIILTPLKIGSIEFIVGTILFSVGLIGISIATINFKNAPFNIPITTGLYKISRNPQQIMIDIIFLGYCLIIGSWFSMILLIISIFCTHFSILGEEKRLLEQYGESYEEYKKKVSRYFLFF